MKAFKVAVAACLFAGVAAAQGFAAPQTPFTAAVIGAQAVVRSATTVITECADAVRRLNVHDIALQGHTDELRLETDNLIAVVSTLQANQTLFLDHLDRQSTIGATETHLGAFIDAPTVAADRRNAWNSVQTDIEKLDGQTTEILRTIRKSNVLKSQLPPELLMSLEQALMEKSEVRFQMGELERGHEPSKPEEIATLRGLTSQYRALHAGMNKLLLSLYKLRQQLYAP